MPRRPDIESRFDAIQREGDSIRARLNDLSDKPALAGEAVEQLRLQMLKAVERDVYAWQARSDALTREVSQRGVLGWARRRSWRLGLALGIIGPLIPVLTIYWGWDIGHIDSRFYEVAAQVIPVLVLAVAVEGRMFEFSGYRSVRWLGVYYILALLWVAAGEAAAFAAIAGGGTDLTFALAAAALTQMGALFVLVAIIGRELRE